MAEKEFQVNNGIWLLVAIFGILVGAAIFFLSSTVGKSANTSSDQTQQAQTAQTPSQSAASSSGQLQVDDEKVGNGAEAKTGDTVSVNYIGTLENGTKFDSSYDRNQPFSFTLGTGQVIKGWDQGIVGMKVGGKRKLTIPPDLAYGNQSVGNIPPNSTLVFEVELLEVK
jgi:FKBP-type peptidyl-prolyl cis-trans isomerase